MEYTVVLHKAEESGYWAEVPSLPGCYSQGETVEETIANTKDAIESHLAVLKSEKKKIPQDDVLVLSHVKV